MAKVMSYGRTRCRDQLLELRQFVAEEAFGKIGYAARSGRAACQSKADQALASRNARAYGLSQVRTAREVPYLLGEAKGEIEKPRHKLRS